MAKKPFEVGQSNPPPSGVVRMVVGDVICVVDSVVLVVVVVDWVLLVVVEVVSIVVDAVVGVDWVLLLTVDDDDPGTVQLNNYQQNIRNTKSNNKSNIL